MNLILYFVLHQSIHFTLPELLQSRI